MFKTKDDGFSLVELLIIVLVAVGIFGSAYILIKKHSEIISYPKTKYNLSSSLASSMTGVALGIDTPTSNDSKAIKEIGKTPAIIDDFVGWKLNGAANPFPKSFVDSVISLGSMPMITWQPDQDISPSNSESVLTTITSGAQDAYIKSWADSAKAENHTIYVRLMHEMNGNWYPWGYGVNGNTPTMYVNAFQHVVKIFQNEGANNVQFIWCVSTSSANSTSTKVDANDKDFFPGDNYISWVAMDGYNRSQTNPKSFSDIFSSTYSTLTNISQRPVMIPEVATVEDPNNPNAKADWITTTFLNTVPNNFPKIKAILYFDSKGNGFTYQIDTSQITLNAIKKVFNNSYYQAKAPTTTLSY